MNSEFMTIQQCLKRYGVDTIYALHKILGVNKSTLSKIDRAGGRIYIETNTSGAVTAVHSIKELSRV